MNYRAFFVNKNFQLHWLCTIVSQTGSFFTFVALPWLVLAMSNNNPLVMSTVMATSSLPHAFFMLFGGVLADRFSPIKTLYISRTFFVLIMFSLASLVYYNAAPLWALYVYAFVLGILGAVAIPASQALLPAIVDKSHLAIANGIVMGSSQLAQIIGPTMAGWLIWWAKSFYAADIEKAEYRSIAIALYIDAIAVGMTLFLMSWMRITSRIAHKEKISSLFLQGFLFCWHDLGIRIVLSYLILISFFLQGTLMAGLPIFTKLHLGLAELAYGSLYAMIGIGTILGIGAGVLLSPPAKHLGAVVLCCDFLSGLALFLLGETTLFFWAGSCLLFIGFCSGIIMVAGTTWFQKRTPDYLMGRVISILMFSILGLIPISAALLGVLMLHYPVTLIMSSAGILIASFALIGFAIPRVRSMGDIPKIEVLQL